MLAQGECLNATPTHADLQTRCFAHLERLQATVDFSRIVSVRDLAQAVAKFRGRQCAVLTGSLPLEIDGVWLEVPTCVDGQPLPQVDIFVVAEDASQVEQEHCLAHEIAHLWLGHDRSHGQRMPRHFQVVLRALDLGEVSAMLCHTRLRDHIDPQIEQEADLLATMMELALDGVVIAPPSPPRRRWWAWWQQGA